MTNASARPTEFSQISADVWDLLTHCRTAGLATADAAGNPHAANVWFAATRAWQIYFVSHCDTAHSSQLALRPTVALTIYAEVSDPSQIRGLQIHGSCAALTDPAARAAALTIYTQKYPFAAAPPLSNVIAAQSLYVVTPHWLRWIDNRRGFGFKLETTLASS